MPPINEILYRFTGDEEDARDAMERLATELEAFARIHAEAEVEVDTTEARVRVDEIKTALQQLDATNVDPRIEVDIAAAMTQLRTVEAQLDHMDGREVDIEIDLDRSLEDRLLGLTRTVGSLTSASAAFDDQGKSFVARLADMAVHVGPFTTQLRVAIPLAGALAAAVVSLGGAIAALASSLGAAIAGLGALAVAFGGALLPAIGLVITAVKRFGQQSDEAGTPAHALAQAFDAISAAARALLPAADPVLRALAEGARALVPLIQAIAPAFKEFGRAAGDATKIVADALSDPAIAIGIADLIRLAGDVFPPLADAATSLFRIFLNIARAAMPLLVAGLQDVATWLSNVADSTDDISRLRDGIGVLVEHTRAWVGLLQAVSSVFINFAKAALPAGKEFVDFLTEGAEKIAAWLDSAEGMDRIQTFFDNTMPLAKALVDLIAQLVLAFIQFGEVAAPIFEPIVRGITEGVKAINFLLNLLAQIPAPIRQIIGIAATLLLPWTKFRLVLIALQAVFGALGAAASAAFGVIKSAAEGAWNGIKTGAQAAVGAVGTALNAITTAVSAAWGAVKDATSAAWGAVRSVTSSVWSSVRNIVRDAAQAVRSVITSAFNAARSAAQSAFNALRNAVSSAIRGARDVVRSVAQSIRDVIRNAFQAARDVAQSTWNAIKDTIGNAIRAAADIVRNAAGNIKDALVTAFRAAVDAVGNVLQQLASVVSRAMETVLDVLGSLVSSFFNAGKNLIMGLVNGIKSAAGAAIDAASDVANAVKDILPFSEPKDPSSPFRGLSKSGAAIIDNIAAGIRARQGELARVLSQAASGIGSVPLDAAFAGAGALGPGSSGTTNHYNINVPTAPAAHGQPDPRHTAAQLGMLLRQRGGR